MNFYFLKKVTMTTSLFNNEFLSDCKLHIHNDDLETTIHGHLSILINKNQYFSKLIEFHKGKNLKDLIFDIDLSSGGSVESALDIIRYIYGEIELDDTFVEYNRTIVDFFALDLITIRPIAVDISDVTRPTIFSIEKVVFNVIKDDRTTYDYEMGFALIIPSKTGKYSLILIMNQQTLYVFIASKSKHHFELEAYYLNYISKSIVYELFNLYFNKYDGVNYQQIAFMEYDRKSDSYNKVFSITTGLGFITKPEEIIKFLQKDLLIDSNLLNIIEDINSKYSMGYSFHDNNSNELKEYTKYHNSEILNISYQ